MKPHIPILIVLLFSTGTLCAQTAAARELMQAQEQRDKALAAAAEPINRRYQASLEALVRRATQAGDLTTSIKIREELEKLGAPGAATGPLIGTTEMQRNQLRARLRGSTWLWGSKTFTLHPDGTTSGSWLPRKGTWKITGPRTAELVISNAADTKKVIFDDEVLIVSFPDELKPEEKTAKRIIK